MTSSEGSAPKAAKHRTVVERSSDREVVVTRTIDAPVRIVFETWTNAELFRRWWVPKSFPVTLLACDLDARVGGKYRLVFGHDGKTMEFFGTYLEVVPGARLVWTNEETEGGGAVTTVSFEEREGKTLIVLRDLHPSKQALDESGAHEAFPETFDQLEELVATLR
jgi:uncharacterized protein YndB with AHSA1/START domain